MIWKRVHDTLNFFSIFSSQVSESPQHFWTKTHLRDRTHWTGRGQGPSLRPWRGMTSPPVMASLHCSREPCFLPWGFSSSLRSDWSCSSLLAWDTANPSSEISTHHGTWWPFCFPYSPAAPQNTHFWPCLETLACHKLGGGRTTVM